MKIELIAARKWSTDAFLSQVEPWPSSGRSSNFSDDQLSDETAPTRSFNETRQIKWILIENNN